nr:unnamed protein product [Digitaria exilis]
MAPPLSCGPGAPKRRLLQAAADGDLQRFKRIASVLDAGKGRLGQTVAAVKDHGAGALHIAAFPGKTALCAFLVEELHQDVNAADESVMQFAKAGADVKDVGTITPLILAVKKGLTDFYKCLLEAGADPNVRDDFGYLPIETAANKNRRKDIEILLPVTSHVPYVHDWSVDGILSYMESMPSMEAARHYPDDLTMFSNRSLCWLKLGEGDRALMDAQVCRMKRPGWAKACYLQGAAQMLLKDYEKATDAFLDGLKLDPANVEIDKALWYCIFIPLFLKTHQGGC